MKKINFLVLFFALVFMSTQAQNVYYVTAEADGTADGSSWAYATSLEAAIAKTTSTSTDIILVKKGTYTAPSAAQTTVSGSISGLGYLFDVKNDVTLYGNCEGTESETNLPTVNENTTIGTFLNAPVDESNAALGRVITIYKCTVKFIGFDISGGDASKNSSTAAYGAGKYGGAVHIKGKGTLRYCKVHGATAQNGGGVYLEAYTAPITPATIEYCEIYGNTSTGTTSGSYGGGGIYIMGSSPEVDVNNCIIRDNTAVRAGGVFIYNASATKITSISNSIIKNNTGTTAHGGFQFYKYGNIVNCLISANTGASGTGGASLGSATQVINSTIVNNTVSSNNASDAGGVAVATGSLKNCIIWGNTVNNGGTNMDLRLASHNITSTSVSTVTNSCYNVASVSSTSDTYQPILTNSIIAADPLFTSAIDFSLTTSSPCKNTGDNTAYDTNLYPSVDLNNHTRIVTTTIDMGAYEFSPTTGISSTISKESNILSIGKGSLIVKSKGNVAIYDVTGKMVSKKESAGSTNFSLNSGIYLVNVSGTTYKIIVQ
ncbi:MAG: T9SS type A sorting domain-containing protein [Paludibacter sp.]|nr:T9SS type A sorting domain-containing protein [Paludibacter sp.]